MRWCESTQSELEGLEESEGLTEEAQHSRRETEFKSKEAIKVESKFWSLRAKRLWDLKGDGCLVFLQNSECLAEQY